MDDEWFIIFLLPVFLMFGWALVRIMLNRWRAGQSILLMDPAVMLYPENRKYFCIMCGCMFVMATIVVIFNMLYGMGHIVP